MTHEHHITLKGPVLEARGLSGHLLRDVFALLVQGTERSLRYRLEGRSTAPGSPPAWVRPASDFQLLAIAESKGARTFEVHAPPLLVSMPDRFKQGQLFDDIDPRKSPFELFEDALEDALLERSDSDVFDYALLQTCVEVRSILGAGLDSVEIKNGRTLVVDVESVARMAALAREPFSARRVRLAGRLESIQYSDCRFTLILAGGEKIAGTARDLGSETLRASFGHEVIVTGTADFRPSGRLLRINAEQFAAATEKDLQIFAAIPRPLKTAAPAERADQSGLGALLGQWPGDEPTEQLLEQLRQLA